MNKEGKTQADAWTRDNWLTKEHKPQLHQDSIIQMHGQEIIGWHTAKIITGGDGDDSWRPDENDN